ncbi:class I SAM-dependent methyltransferase [Streptomyces odontomachi]|uniref:class I SAM-dependent methyltransferase n=1 Tax=Streptomyces odontomachi TaxID=2944940 RepID=UPI00210E75DA|nr:class I SAM-dependent methyltransferase [Streptomyces sp. ODS25]
MTTPPRPSRAHSFNAVAAQYAAHRPSYPPALFDTVEELTGRPLSGARVVDVGAGTGIATALLAGRGAHVVAVEPGDGMASQFRRTLPDVPLVRGNGNALPLADATADVITYAQSWHWTEPARSTPEAMRVLRPGGTLALWWNVPDPDVPWLAAQHERISGHCGATTGARGTADRLRALGTELDVDFTHSQVRWSRRVHLDAHLANLGSHSHFLVMARDDATAFLTEERAHLRKEFPDEMLEESYVVDLLTTRRPTT